MNDNHNQPAFPTPIGSFEGITKREYFAAMAKTPDAIIQLEIDMWRGDGNKLPHTDYPDFDKMLKAIAALESKYAAYKADALLEQLSKVK